MSQEVKQDIYFPNLNSVRLLAAIMVVVYHIDQFRGIFKVPGYIEPYYLDANFVLKAGALGVMLFFTLSGFLITYLLLLEKKITGSISIKNFYIRRILRIWPLYFLICILTLFIYPHIPFFNTTVLYKLPFYDHYALKIILFLLILPNLILSIYPDIPFGWHSWSIGAEEQFYAIWPWLIKYSKNIFRVLIATILLYITISHSLKLLCKHYPSINSLTVINDFLETMHIDIMAIGGLYAFIGFSNKNIHLKLKNILFNKWLQIFIIFITIFFLAKGIHVPVINFEFYALLFGYIIFNLALNKKSVINLEYKPLIYLGEISYGLYMYHGVIVIFSILILLKYGIYNDYYVYLLVTTLTIAIASISYYFFEKPILSKKSKFLYGKVKAKP